MIPSKVDVLLSRLPPASNKCATLIPPFITAAPSDESGHRFWCSDSFRLLSFETRRSSLPLSGSLNDTWGAVLPLKSSIFVNIRGPQREATRGAAEKNMLAVSFHTCSYIYICYFRESAEQIWCISCARPSGFLSDFCLHLSGWRSTCLQPRKSHE